MLILGLGSYLQADANVRCIFVGSGAHYNYDTHVPLCFYGGRIENKTIDAPVDMTWLAPTLAQMLGMPMPAPPQERYTGKVI